jgi:mono/diheme cytochrome c family protein
MPQASLRAEQKNANRKDIMKQLSSFSQLWWRGTRFVAMAAAVYALSLACIAAADAKADKDAKPDKKTEKKADKKPQYSGSELYAMHCNRCHPERYATERTSGQWKTLMIHMRVRANLPAEQAKSILKYLQEDSGK